MSEEDRDRIISILKLMKQLPPNERLVVINNFCKGCGENDPECQCWNDE